MSRDRALDRLAHAVLWPGFAGTTAPAWLLRARDAGAPGAVLFATNIDDGDPHQAARLVAELGGPDAVVGIDEEGGSVTRLHARTGSPVPGHAVLGRHDDVTATAAVAARIGTELAQRGIGVDLAPVADVNSNPANPVIGVRSFGAEPDLVARHTAAYVRGLQDTGTAACAKHFPGHGDTATDSHLGGARSSATVAGLEEIHLAPFRAAIDAGVRAVLTAHLVVDHLGPEPATVNPRATALLRGLGFDGVIVSDALDMRAISATLGIGGGAVAALRAGVDLLCLGNAGVYPVTAADPHPDERTYAETQHAIVEALRSGDLDPEVLEAAAARIAALRSWVSQQRSANGARDTAPITDRAAVDVARGACEVHGDVALQPRSTVVVVDGRAGRNEAAGVVPDPVAAALAQRRPITAITAAGTALADVLDTARDAQLVLVLDQPHLHDVELDLLTAVLAARPDAVVVRLGWPAELAPTPARVVTTYGSSAASGRAVAALLCGPQ
ncbi:glycoside hydrolase family 3 N-terminal domain-containing protein [Occultella aeris]|uniref:Putative lipoprotein YbbD n=1 Tax=Occultella aeris TaxID=2761496 RepID=A0A7M4DFU9_9MICO|nr:glycoside hydrolase family 3 N-terminal domain-containing protein [Occultella aeris]VZO35792.1 putative lipoprotein YbbD precursor [Occultella aeris]